MKYVISMVIQAKNRNLIRWIKWLVRLEIHNNSLLRRKWQRVNSAANAITSVSSVTDVPNPILVRTSPTVRGPWGRNGGEALIELSADFCRNCERNRRIPYARILQSFHRQLTSEDSFDEVSAFGVTMKSQNKAVHCLLTQREEIFGKRTVFPALNELSITP
jgi:hypothetical protein